MGDPEKKTAEEAQTDVQQGQEGKETPTPPVETPAAPDPMEVAARAEGWRPKDEFEGDPEQWVDAKAFLERKPLFQIIRNQSRTIKSMGKQIDTIKKNFDNTVSMTVKSRLTELKRLKTEAIKEGDVERVGAIDKAIEDNEAALPEDGPEVPEVITRWVEENAWYRNDPEMHDFALAINDSYMRRNPTDVEGGLQAALDAVKKAFPDRFGKKRTPTGEGIVTPPPGSVEGGGKPPSKGKTLSVSRLSPEQRRVHDQYVTAGILTSEDYLKGLEEIGELK